jgi:uncharacterized membrane protein
MQIALESWCLDLDQNRIPEIDFFRTIALGLMILYHLIYDLDVWTNIAINVNSTHWFLIGKISALLFIFLSGVSSGLSKHPVKNGLRVLFWGLVISLVTWITLPDEYVRFGILHFLGTMMLCYPFLKRLPNTILLFLTGMAIGLSFSLSKVISTVWLIPFGLTYPGFTSMDYYPLIPYSGVTFLGILFYRHYLKGHLVTVKDPSNSPSPSILNSSIFKNVSRNSLIIYLIHQPIILSVIYLLNQENLFK